MPSQNWDELEEKYEYGLTLDKQARAAWLKKLAQTHPKIAPVLTQLFVVNSPVDDFFERTPGEQVRPFLAATETQDRPVDDEQPDFPVIRNYKITHLIDHGGMGLVYRAEQESPVKREVALKIIQPHCVGNEEYWARFFAERDVLARLSHSAIARLFDSGFAEDGRPYFSMELVEGQPIDDYCQEKELSLKQRLELFVQLSRGMLHAHQKLVIHRDLKPGNILVSHVQGRPAVKIIDFGISKQLAAPQEPAQPMTQVGNYMGTIPYLSPEQAMGSGTATDSRTDLYALGVVLYEMLTDSWPFETDELEDQPLDHRLRIIRQTDPIKPSKRLESNADWLNRIAKFSGQSPKQILTIFRQDLDWILLKALEKEPDRRYEAVSALIQDVEALLGHQPIQARPPSRLYRAKKFYQRYKVITLAATTVFLVAIAGLAAVIVSNFRTLQANQQAELALESRKMALGYLDSTLRIATPNREGRGLSVRQLTQIATEKVAEELPGEPVTQSFVYTIYGSHFRALGEYERAEKLFQQALDIRLAELGTDHLYTWEAMEVLASLKARLKQKTEALGTYTNLENRLLETKQTESDLFVKTLFGLGLLKKESEPSKAEFNFFQVLQILNDNPDFDQDLRYQARTQLGFIAKNAGRNAEAAQIFENVLKELEKLGDTQILLKLFCQAYLGDTYTHLNKEIQGITLLEDAYNQLQSRLGKENLGWLDVSLLLARAQRRQGNYSEAETILLETTQLLEMKFGKESPQYVDHTINLANVLEKSGYRQEAIEALVKLTSFSDEFEGEHPKIIGRVLNNLGNYYLETYSFEKAQWYLEEALELKLAHLEPEEETVIITQATLAEIFFMRRELIDARNYSRWALEMLQQSSLKKEELHNFINGLHRLSLLAYALLEAKDPPTTVFVEDTLEIICMTIDNLETNLPYQELLRDYYKFGFKYYCFPKLEP